MRRTLDWIRGYDRWKLDSPPEHTIEGPHDHTDDDECIDSAEPDWDAIREDREDVQREREERGEW